MHRGEVPGTLLPGFVCSLAMSTLAEAIRADCPIFWEETMLESEEICAGEDGACKSPWRCRKARGKLFGCAGDVEGRIERKMLRWEGNRSRSVDSLREGGERDEGEGERERGAHHLP